MLRSAVPKTAPYFFACILLAGCKMVALAPKGHTLDGEWAFYAPISRDPGTITFKGPSFIEKFPMGSGANSAILNVSGHFTLTGNDLHLEAQTFQIDGSVSFEAQSLRENFKKNGMWDYALEWVGDNVVYLNVSNSSAGVSAAATFAISRFGAKPDLARVALSFDSSTGSSQGTSAQSDRRSATTTTESSNSPQPTSPNQAGQDQNQTTNLNPPQSPPPAPIPPGSDVSPPIPTTGQPEAGSPPSTKAPPAAAGGQPGQGLSGQASGTG